MASHNTNLAPTPAGPDHAAPPAKPHPRLFLLLCVLFAVWIALLLWLYFAAVYPQRHPAH